jgi:hypothetical protein
LAGSVAEWRAVELVGFFDRLLGRSGPSAKTSGRELMALDDVKDDVVSMSWSASEDSCAACKAMDGMVYLPDSTIHAPHPECTSPRGCTCFEIVLFARDADERDPEFERYVRAQGGMITADMQDEYDRARRAADPASQASDMQHASSAVAARAHDAEATRDLEQASELYRESIWLDREAARLITDDPWRFRDLPYLYDRLTLVLERLKRDEEALAAIREYESLGLPAHEPMAKRHLRICKRLGRT